MNGKGSSPRSCFSNKYRSNYDKVFRNEPSSGHGKAPSKKILTEDKPCAKDGCQTLVDRSHTYCEEHKPKFKKTKPSKRMPKGWSALRKRFILSQPIPIHCAMCNILLLSPKSIQVDHIIPRKHGGTNDLNNLQCLCRKCHTRKTMEGL